MTDTEITNAMAEMEGWKGPHHPENIAGMAGWWSQERGVWWLTPDGHRVMAPSVPSYLTDANAVLRVLAKDSDGWMYDAVAGRLTFSPSWKPNKYVGISSASDPVHRFCLSGCSAVLRAHGKWREQSSPVANPERRKATGQG